VKLRVWAFDFGSCIIEDLGMVSGKELDIIIGATTMEEGK